MTEAQDVRLTVDDLIPPYCAWGLRSFWKLHGLDFADFLKNGILASALLATGDATAEEAVARKRGSRRGQ